MYNNDSTDKKKKKIIMPHKNSKIHTKNPHKSELISMFDFRDDGKSFMEDIRGSEKDIYLSNTIKAHIYIVSINTK